MKDYLIKYRIEDHGDSIYLMNITPYRSEIEDLYYEGHLLREIWVNDNGVFEMRIRVTDNEEFGIVSLEKVYGS